MTRALLLGLALAGRVMADGDYTTNSTVDANTDRVVFGVQTAHRITGSHTVACSWRGTANGTHSRLVSRSASGTAENYNLRVITTGDASIRASSGAVTGAGYSAASASTSGNDGARHHAALVYTSGTDASVFFDGVSDGTDASVATPDDPAHTLTFGTTGNGAGGFGSGEDSLKHQGETYLYADALTAGEVSQLAAVNSFRHAVRDLRGHWQQLGKPGTSFGGAGTVMDWSANKLHGDGDDGSPDPTYSVMMKRGAGR